MQTKTKWVSDMKRNRMKAEWTNSDSLTTSQTTKAILVIDMPERCVDCPLCEGEGYPLCTAIHKNIGSLAYYFGGDKERNPYCPLRPMPQKMRTDSDDIE